MKIIEFLYPELCNIYAESYNVEYLAKCNDQIKVIKTRFGETPAFVNNDIDMVYIGGTTEASQEKIAAELMQYTDRINQIINQGVILLVTGNSIELFGEFIQVDGSKKDLYYTEQDLDRTLENSTIKMLGLFRFYAVRDMINRHNSQFIGYTRIENNEKLLIMGHKSQFSLAYFDNDNNSEMSYAEENSFIRIEAGVGMNPKCDFEGIRKNNFFATYSLGPFLILNPPFCKYLLRLLGLDDKLCFEEAAMNAYNFRVQELRNFLNGGKR